MLSALGALAFALLAWLLWAKERETAPGGELQLFCAAGIRMPVEELAADYEERFGVRVALQYGGSGTLLAGLEVTPRGDLYLAGDDSFVDRARDAGLVREELVLARMRAVIAVRTGNPLAIEGLEDLARPDVRVALADPEAAAVGRIARKHLRALGTWDTVLERASVTKPTVTELATDLGLGVVDAAVLWDATVAQFPALELVRATLFESDPRTITIGVLTSSSQPTEALRFARFLAARDAGGPVFARHGFEPARGDVFERTPRLSIASGAMLSPAVRETLHAFAEREGARIDTTYNGCGILVAQMRAGAVPDAYLSCDTTFLNEVDELFEDGVELTSNAMVILVASGNPRGIETLTDLARPGLRVGLAHPEKSALGALTVGLLQREQLTGGLAASGNLVVDSPTGDLLVNQLRTGSLDAAIVYASNAAHAREHVDLVPIDSAGARATQPIAIARGARHKALLGRLFDALRGSDSRVRFEALGFRWESE
ncbi:MAG: solute-binding protein [bacterium]|nr:solute-binding protein [bacterium]